MTKFQRYLILGISLLMGLVPALAGAVGQEGGSKIPTAKINSDGVVKAFPDIAIMNLAIITEAAKAPLAATENAKQAEAFLAAVKKFCQAGDTVKSTGYRVTPFYTYPKGKKPVIAGYRARHGFQVRLSNLERLGELIDLGVQQGADEISGPIWEHAKIEALTQGAAVQALQKAQAMATALAQSLNLKVKRLQQVSTTTRATPVFRGKNLAMAAAAPDERVATPIEVGEEEIRVQIEAVFELE